MNPSTALAVTLADELIRCGLAEVVLAPGSRSAPLAMEFHRRAERGDLRLHVRIDERSAAYLALGLAKAGGRPAAVLCTSGTAAASRESRSAGGMDRPRKFIAVSRGGKPVPAGARYRQASSSPRTKPA